VSKARKLKVTAAVKAIRQFYALGQKLPKKQAHSDAYNQRTIDAAAKEHGLNADIIRKARQFADPVAGYTREEVNELCRSIVEVQSDQADTNSVFGRTHLIRLLSVKKDNRRSLQETAIREGWSTGELEAHIAAKYGIRRDGGRKRHIPGDLLGILAQLEQRCESWRRWHSQVTPDAGQEKARIQKRTLDVFPSQVHRLVNDAAAAMAKLHQAVTDELSVRQPGRGLRYKFRVAANENGGRSSARR